MTSRSGINRPPLSSPAIVNRKKARKRVLCELADGSPVDDYGDDYGLRVYLVPIVHRSRRPLSSTEKENGVCKWTFALSSPI